MAESEQLAFRFEGNPVMMLFWSFVLGAIMTALVMWALIATHVKNRPIQEMDIEILKLVFTETKAYCRKIKANQFKAVVSGLNLDLWCKPVPAPRRKTKRKGV